MKVLMLGEWGHGGIQSHVRCLLKVLKSIQADSRDFSVYCIGEDESYVGAKNGHDIRKFFQIRKVMKNFKPDVVHIQKFSFMMCVYLKFFTRCPRIFSIHTPSRGKENFKTKIQHWLLSPCYYLPVSIQTWKGFCLYHPNARGEVFYNPLNINLRVRDLKSNCITRSPIVGLVGRYAEEKDWLSFAKVTSIISQQMDSVEFWGIGVTKEEARVKLGELASHIDWKGFQKNGREWIGMMDIFILTSIREELPTVVLEAFAERTAICGFIPEGGMEEILSHSTGPLKEVFIKERNISRLVEIVQELIHNESKRCAVIEDGWQIVTKFFDADKNCRSDLIDIYRRVVK